MPTYNFMRNVRMTMMNMNTIDVTRPKTLLGFKTPLFKQNKAIRSIDSQGCKCGSGRTLLCTTL